MYTTASNMATIKLPDRNACERIRNSPRNTPKGGAPVIEKQDTVNR
jgi:hypothetical protein